MSITEAPSFTSSATINTWEFPLLAKYRLSTPVIKPFLEAGPSFRHVSLFSGDSPHLSQAGFTAGVGVGFKLMRLRIDPEIRYTRWGTDSKPSPYLFDPRSNVNQAELLLGLSFQIGERPSISSGPDSSGRLQVNHPAREPLHPGPQTGE